MFFNDLFLNEDISSPQSLKCGFSLATEHKFLTFVAKFNTSGQSRTLSDTVFFTACTLIKNTVKTAMFWNIITSSNNCFPFEYILKCNLFLWCKASLLQSSVSYDPSEIILICWFTAQETFLIIINVENSSVSTNIHIRGQQFLAFKWFILKLRHFFLLSP